jgi:DNA-directed RNA polymerase specialized sigma24 family protein
VAPGAPGLAAGIRGDMTDRERLLDALRPVSFAIAYRMLGSVSEAEDSVQEALVRLHRALEEACRSARRGHARPQPSQIESLQCFGLADRLADRPY